MKNVMGLYAYYDLTINPKENDEVIISTDDETVKSWLATPDGKIPQFFDMLKKCEIGVGGMNIDLKNNRLHAIDSKPVCYEITLIESLRKALFSDSARKIVKSPLLNSNRYNIFEFTEFQSHDYANYERLSIDLKGLKNDDFILLKQSNEIQILDSSIVTFIRPKYNMYYSTSRHISLLFKNDQFADSLKLKFYQVIKMLELEFLKEQKDLGEFEIFIEFTDKEKFEKDTEFILDWEWSIRNLLANNQKLKKVDNK